ncbi:hypothetical protein ACHAQH_009128 [Verticillium albo-atrum]
MTGEEFGEPNQSDHSKRGRASKSKRPSGSSRSSTRTVPKGCLNTFNVYLQGLNDDEYVQARAVIDPDYDGPPLISNALVSSLGNALVSSRDFVSFNKAYISTVVIPSLGEKVRKSGSGVFTYHVTRTKGCAETLSDKLEFFEGKFAEKAELVFGLSWRGPEDLILDVWWIGKGKKKDEEEERAQKKKDIEISLRREAREKEEQRRKRLKATKRPPTIPEEPEAGPSTSREQRTQERPLGGETPEGTYQEGEGYQTFSETEENQTQWEDSAPHEETQPRPGSHSQSHRDRLDGRRPPEKQSKKKDGFSFFKKRK